MTDIGVFTQTLISENLAWDRSNPEVPFIDGGSIDVSLFDQTQHYPNGFLPSGTVLGRVTATGLLGPYLDTATDGRQTAVGILRASVMLVQPNGVKKSKIGVAVMTAFGVISQARLPFTSANAALGGFIDANGIADLAHLHFVA